MKDCIFMMDSKNMSLTIYLSTFVDLAQSFSD